MGNKVAFMNLRMKHINIIFCRASTRPDILDLQLGCFF